MKKKKKKTLDLIVAKNTVIPLDETNAVLWKGIEGTQSYIVPNILQANMNYVVVDENLKLAEQYTDYFLNLGYRIKIFPFGCSLEWNKKSYDNLEIINYEPFIELEKLAEFEFPDINLKMMENEFTIIFIGISANQDNYTNNRKILLWQIMHELRVVIQAKNETHVFLDKIEKIGYLSNLEFSVATLNDRRVKISIICQDISLMEQIYGKEMGSMLICCSLWVIEERFYATENLIIYYRAEIIKTDKKYQISSQQKD